MRTFFKSIAALAIAGFVAIGCEEMPVIPVEKPNGPMPQISPLPYCEANLYAAEYNKETILAVNVKDADVVTVVPEGFEIDYELEEYMDVGATLAGKKSYKIHLTGAKGLEKDKVYNLKIIAQNAFGQASVDKKVSLIYLDNPFTDGVIKQQPGEEHIDDNSWNGEFCKTQYEYIGVNANCKFTVTLLDSQDWAKLGRNDNKDMDLRYDELKDITNSFRLIMKDNLTNTPRRLKFRIADKEGVIVHEGEYEQARYADLTIEEEMAKELAAMKIIRDALGLKDDPDYGDNVPLNQWPGVWAPDYPNGGYFVRAIEWRGPLICGQIPEAVKDLDHCLTFRLYADHRVTGKIPDGFGDMKNLRHLEVCNPEEGYGLEGRIDNSSLSKIAKQLVCVNFACNNLTGSYPEWLGDTPDYCRFGLLGNRLEGKVPEKVQNHPHWKSDDLSGTNETCGAWEMKQQPGYVLYL